MKIASPAYNLHPEHAISTSSVCFLLYLWSLFDDISQDSFAGLILHWFLCVFPSNQYKIFACASVKNIGKSFQKFIISRNRASQTTPYLVKRLVRLTLARSRLHTIRVDRRSLVIKSVIQRKSLGCKFYSPTAIFERKILALTVRGFRILIVTRLKLMFLSIQAWICWSCLRFLTQFES
jgi:hypothetical protein